MHIPLTSLLTSVRCPIVLSCQLIARILFVDLNIHSFIRSFVRSCVHSFSSRLLLRSTPDPCIAEKNSFQTRVECVRIILTLEAIAVDLPMEAHFTQMTVTGQTPRMYGSALT